jgi:hypothetical protein
MPFKDYKDKHTNPGQAQGGVQAGKGMQQTNGAMGGDYSATPEKAKLQEEPSIFDNESPGGVEGNQKKPKMPGKTLFVDKTITDVTFTNDPNAGVTNVLNPFRRDTRTYWHYYPEEQEYKIRQKPQPIGQGQFILGSEQLNVQVCFQKISSIEKSVDNADYMPNLLEKYKVYLQQGAISILNLKEDNLWTNWVDSVTSKAYYRDICFKMNEANPNLNLNEALYNSLSPIKTNIVAIKTEYNYFNKQYEEVISEAVDNEFYNIDEKSLPNLYTFMLSAEESPLTGSNIQQAVNQEANPTDVFREHTTIGNTLEGIDKDKIFFSKTTKKFDIKDAPINYYFNAWSKGLSSLLNAANITGDTDFGQEYFSKIIFSDASYNDVLKYNNDVDNFPMHAKVSIATSPNNNFYKALKDTNYSSLLLNYLSLLEEPLDISFIQQDAGPPYNDETPRKVWDFNGFLDSVINGTLDDAIVPEDSIFLGETLTTEQMFAKENSLFNKLMSLALKSKIKTMAKKAHRNFENIINGGVGYSETFFFEVEKWSSNAAGLPVSLIQTFYLPNSENKMIEFMDTQIIPDKFYIYRIWAHKMVIGTDLNITPVPGTLVDTKEEKSVEMNFYTKPTIKIIRMPYFNVSEAPLPVGDNASINPPPHDTVMIMDDPPLAPEIDWAPIIEQPGKMIFNIKDKIGEEKMFPRIIGNDVDILQLLNVLFVQKKNELGLTKEQLGDVGLEKNKIRFSSDDASAAFEVYALQTKPTSYTDFKDRLLNTYLGPNTSFKYHFNFNEKNYFVFRAIDQKGKYSNLTDVYEIEFKENSGVSYPEVRIFNIEEENKKMFLEKQKALTKNTITAKKFLYVRPSLDQRDVTMKYQTEPDDLDSAFDLKDFSIGTSEQSVFRPDRKFKIRLKSKKTGKKIDFNIRFNHKHEKIIIK